MTTNELHIGIVYVVLMLDELVHTDEHPYCSDLTCPCQLDREQESADSMAQSEAWLARQAAQHEEDKAYFSMWGLHEDTEDWQPPYTRADAEGDAANAAYYDELARRV